MPPITREAVTGSELRMTDRTLIGCRSDWPRSPYHTTCFRKSAYWVGTDLWFRCHCAWRFGVTSPWREPIEWWGSARKIVNVINEITATSTIAQTSRLTTKTSTRS